MPAGRERKRERNGSRSSVGSGRKKSKSSSARWIAFSPMFNGMARMRDNGREKWKERERGSR